MRLYTNLVSGVTSTLSNIFQKNEYADKAVQQLLKSNSKWGSRDRRFLAESIYEIVRWYRLYYEILGQKPKTIDDWYGIFGIYWILKGESLPDWKEFSNLDEKEIQKQFKNIDQLEIKASIPDWLNEMGKKELKENWEATIMSLNERSSTVLRVNTLKTSQLEAQKALEKENIETSILSESALVLKERKNIVHTKAFRNGYFEVQDASSQEVALFSEIKPDMTIVDACAGAGGKTLHLAALMENKGKLVATDIFGWKLRELAKRAKRAGASIIRIKTIHNDQIFKDLYDTADRVLLDAPCSGLGVLRRNPDSKWKLSPKAINDVIQIQKEILDNYSPITKKGGLLIYVTCSILPSENQEQVQAFLKRNSNFELIEEKTLLPQDFGFDGFYMAKMRRKSE